MTKTDIKQMAKLKIAHLTHALSLADKVKVALAQFDGKSITGNKKRISDAIEQIDPGLRVYIEPDGYGWVWLRVKCYAKDRSFRTSDGHAGYIDGTDTLLWELVKDNVINADFIAERIENYKNNTARELERVKTTARDIEKIAQKVKKLHDELTKIALVSDSELTAAFGISYKHF